MRKKTVPCTVELWKATNIAIVGILLPSLKMHILTY